MSEFSASEKDDQAFFGGFAGIVGAFSEDLQGFLEVQQDTGSGLGFGAGLVWVF